MFASKTGANGGRGELIVTTMKVSGVSSLKIKVGRGGSGGLVGKNTDNSKDVSSVFGGDGEASSVEKCFGKRLVPVVDVLIII